VAEKTISLRELDELEEDGAEVEYEREITKIEQFDQLVDKLDRLIAAQEERARADLARSQTQLEVLATLQALIRDKRLNNAVVNVDLTPLRSVLEEIQAAQEHRSRVAYFFDVKRDGRGYIDSITAQPRGETLN